MDPIEAVQTLALALLLGMLVGLQRERKAKHIAGFMSMPIIMLALFTVAVASIVYRRVTDVDWALAVSGCP